MNKSLRASRDCAIALTNILRDFKDNPTQKNLAKTMNNHGISARSAGHVMTCLKEMGYVTSHGRNGNKSHFNSDFRTSQVMCKLRAKGHI